VKTLREYSEPDEEEKEDLIRNKYISVRW